MIRTQPVDEYVYLTPSQRMAFGEDVYIDLTGTEDASAWTLEMRCSYIDNGPPDSSIVGVTATYTGGASFVIRVFIPAAATAALTAECTMYVELWRVDSAQHYPLRRIKIPVYDPVRPAT